MARPKKTAKAKPEKPVKPPSKPGLYDGILARSSAHILEASRKGRDVFPAPEIQDRARRDAAFGSLERFLTCYFPKTFRLPFCGDHRLLIEKLEAAIEHGGLLALALPRGQGKSSIVERAAIWAIATGRKKFVAIIAANEKLAEKSLEKIKAELERNPLILADFPKLVWALHRLEGQSRRCAGQLYGGARTRITYKKKELILPSMPGPDNEGSGSAIFTSGITSAVRGLSYVDDTGATIRPDLILCDDPQDRESSRSATQTAERLAIISGDLLAMSGPGTAMTCVVPCTVINRRDLSDQLLDPETCPEWDRIRCKLVNSWPDRMDMWTEYLLLRRKNRREATEFLADRFDLMHAGSSMAWPERYDPGELSALQNAFHLKAKMGEAGFMAEMQNEPLDIAKLLDGLDPAAIASRCSGFERGVAPPESEKVTAAIDCGEDLLWWTVCAWDELFGCSIVTYGSWPEQRQRMFLSRNASPKLGEVYPGGADAALVAGLTDLVGKLINREWKRSDSATLPLSRILIDQGWNTEVIRRFIRGSQHREKLTPSLGKPARVTQSAMAEWTKHQGEKHGEGWILSAASKTDHLRTLKFESNEWKTRLAGMLTRPMGQRGGVTLHGTDPSVHELISVHLSSEYSTLVEGGGRKINQWDRRLDRENHMWDTLILCAVGASFEGISPLASLGAGKPVEQPRKRFSMSAMQQAAQRKRAMEGRM